MQTRLSLLKSLSVVLVAGGIAWAAAAPQEKPAAEPVTAAKIGAAAPAFELKDCAGKAHRLSDYKDKVVVLEWLNRECPWSQKGRTAVAELHKKFAPQGVVFLGIDSTYGRAAEENVKYAQEVGIEFPILMDAEGQVGRLYGAKTTPHVFVINKGTLVYAGALHNDQHGRKEKGEVRNYVDEALTAVLAGKDVPLAETQAWGCPVKYKKGK